jgi:glyceraldehyde-3-phosphate dehydrogenase (NADP+)
MIDEAKAVRVENWVTEAVAAGAELLCGGTREGAYYAPTVLTNTNTSMKVVCEEVFGPVVIVEPYDTFEDAVSQINNSRFGLQAGVFTNDVREMDYAFANIEAGGIILNDVPTFRVDHMPYGGVKDSGLGREGVAYAIRDMLEARILVK